jgi:hypothetical protein
LGSDELEKTSRREPFLSELNVLLIHFYQYEEVYIIYGTGVAICTAVAVAQ